MDCADLSKALGLSRVMATLIDQSVSVTQASVNMGFLNEFPEMDIRARIQAKIHNSLEEELLKLNRVIDESSAKMIKNGPILDRSKMPGSDILSSCANAEEPLVSLFNRYERTKDYEQLCLFLCNNLRIAAAIISYDDVTSLKQLESSLNEMKILSKLEIDQLKNHSDPL